MSTSEVTPSPETIHRFCLVVQPIRERLQEHRISIPENCSLEAFVQAINNRPCKQEAKGLFKHRVLLKRPVVSIVKVSTLDMSNIWNFKVFKRDEAMTQAIRKFSKLSSVDTDGLLEEYYDTFGDALNPPTKAILIHHEVDPGLSRAAKAIGQLVLSACVSITIQLTM